MEPFIDISPVLAEATGEPYQVLLPLGLILLLAKLFSMLMGKIHLPQVVGFLLAGLVIGCFFFIPNQIVLTDYTMTAIDELAKIGVVLILFSAGLETDLRKIKADGVASLLITSLGVIVPLGFGFLAAWLCIDQGLANPYECIYYGVILTATSVSITVATLKELGRLNGRVGTAITAAAILDDVIGVILLSVVISLSGSGSTTRLYSDIPALNIAIMILIMASFFVLSILAGMLIHRLFDYMGKRWPHHRRIPMLGLAFCFLWSWMAEYVFQVADITGAYVAGLIIANTSAASYIDHRTDQVANLIFVPVFFASVALKMFTSFSSGITLEGNALTMFIVFGCIWVVLGLLGKFLGAGIGAKASGFKWKESAIIGVGMMARAEVLIVTAQKGIDAGLINSLIMPFTLALIIISSFLTPILLKALYKKEPPENGPEITENHTESPTNLPNEQHQ